MRAFLEPHPQTPSAVVKRITVDISCEGPRLRLTYGVDGDTAKVLWPGPATVGRADGLWRHTCFEAFVQSDEGYHEFNLSISGQWASYRFEDYRQGMAQAVEEAERVSLEVGVDHTEVGFLIDLPEGAHRLGLSAVLEDIDGEISYWALAHPSDKPDFHHPDSFVLELP